MLDLLKRIFSFLNSGEPASAQTSFQTTTAEQSAAQSPQMPRSLDKDALVAQLLAITKSTHGLNLEGDKRAMQRICEAAHKASAQIHQKGAAEVSLPFITAAASGSIHLNAKLGRS